MLWLTVLGTRARLQSCGGSVSPLRGGRMFGRLAWLVLVLAPSPVLLTVAATPAPALDASPGNGLIAFVSTRDGTSEIYVMNPDGTEQRRLTVNPAEDVSPAWSPDGRRLAFASNRDGNWDIYTIAPDGSDLKRLTDNSDFDGSPSWSPDGSRIAFASARDGNSEIYVMNADGSDQTRLTSSPADDAAPAWGPGTSSCGTYTDEIAFESDRDGNYDIYAIQPDGSGLVDLTSDPTEEFDPSWAPDCSAVAFDRVVEGNYDVFRREVASGAVTQLTSSPGEDSRPAWSPDGHLISFTSLRDGHYEIYVMDARDGSGPVNLSNSFPNADIQPAWQAAASVTTSASLAWRARRVRTSAARQLSCVLGPRAASKIEGTDSWDVICSATQGQILNGKRGNDYIDDSGGKDTVYGGRGNDAINARDGVKDIIFGGPGVDQISADRFDIIRRPTGDHVLK
jgi:Tol biopolymer transport system component